MKKDSKKIEKFSDKDLRIIQEHFHKLIIERAKKGWNCSEFLANEDKNLPVISNKNQKNEEWYAVPGMYGGFAYKLYNKNGEPMLLSNSWSRVVGGSGQRHEITTSGYILIEEGFV